jgi:exonuclease SbcC
MFTKLTITDFQSHASSELSLSPRVNAIVGPSDAGKTAIWRALRYILYGEPVRGVNEFVRKGCDNFKIELETDHGRIVRIKGKKNELVIQSAIDEEPLRLEKIGAALAPELQEKLHVITETFPAVIDDSRSIALNISDALNAPFLLFEQGSAAGRIFSRLGSLSKIDAVAGQLSGDRRSEQRTVADLERRKATLADQAAQYADLESRDQQLTELEATLQATEAKQRKLDHLRRISREVDLIRQKWSNIPTVEPVVVDTSELRTKIQQLSRLQSLAGTLASLDAAITKTKTIQPLEVDLTEAHAKVVRLSTIRRAYGRLTNIDLQVAAQSGVEQAARDAADIDAGKYERALVDLGQCPLCKQSITTEVAQRCHEQLTTTQ